MPSGAGNEKHAVHDGADRDEVHGNGGCDGSANEAHPNWLGTPYCVLSELYHAVLKLNAPRSQLRNALTGAITRMICVGTVNKPEQDINEEIGHSIADGAHPATGNNV